VSEIERVLELTGLVVLLTFSLRWGVANISKSDKFLVELSQP
jgi:hypothetical protein